MTDRKASDAAKASNSNSAQTASQLPANHYASWLHRFITPAGSKRSPYFFGQRDPTKRDSPFELLPNSERKLTPAQEATDAFQFNRCELLKKKVLSKSTSLPSFILRAMRREGCVGEFRALSAHQHLTADYICAFRSGSADVCQVRAVR